MSTPDPFVALALQSRCQAINGAASTGAARAMMDAAAARLAGEVRAASAWLASFYGAPLRLVVLPEYILTGFPMRESFAEWREKAALDPDSAIHRALGDIAIDNATYLVVNLYERHDLAPELYFQATLIFAPSGAVILRYLRMISINTPSPYDFWDRFIEQEGAKAAFPVVDTDIGRLGVIASEEILFPEIARMLGFQGVEILAHCTSELASPSLTPKDIAKRARAIENAAFLVSANTAGIEGIPLPAASADGMSKIVGPDGQILADTLAGPTTNAAAVIDLAPLRAKRLRAAMTNLPPRLPAAAFADFYRTAPALAPNGLAQGMVDRADLRQRLTHTARGMFTSNEREANDD